MAAGPMLKWRRDGWSDLGRRTAIPVVLTAAVLALVAIAAPAVGILPLLGMGVALGVGIASLAPLWGRDLRRTPLFTWGMVVAHLGVAVSLIGMAASTAYTQERLVAVGTGDPARVAGFTVRLEGVRPLVGDNWTALEGRLAVTLDDEAIAVLRPQVRYFTTPVTTTNESAILTRWDGQLYAVLGTLGEDGRWQLRLWWKPMVTLIWFGGFLIALGGALALVGHQWRLWHQRRRADALADTAAWGAA
jgi:cytochrome c-type biogenesis protein CcmF